MEVCILEAKSIIYFNEFSNKKEPFSKQDMLLAKEFTIAGQSFSTPSVFFTLLSRQKFAIPYVDPYFTEPLLSNHTLGIDLITKNEFFLDFQISDKIELLGETVGFIRLSKNFDRSYKALNGNGVVVIHDIQLGAGSKVANAALGAFAVAFGAYAFGEHDGIWK